MEELQNTALDTEHELNVFWPKYSACQEMIESSLYITIEGDTQILMHLPF